MKVVINNCFGGFGLSPKAIKKYLKLIGKKCYFFKYDYDTKKYIKVKNLEIKNSIFYTIFTISNPNTILPKESLGKDGTCKEYNKIYNKINFYDHDIERTDLNLIKVVEELREEASGSCANLKIVEIPNNTQYQIDEYDGLESIHEKHRSWN